ncbi:MAG: polysaccharide biosynthesis protein [Bacteroidaceae bacterium]|nr:polysaccharide biosynthesis protein [Bacteroidaceae bacterium]
MNFFQDLIQKYFSKGTLPYWYILAIDSLIVVSSGYLSLYLEVGGYTFLNTFWQSTWGLILTLILFVISFGINHTYRGFVRYSTFADLRRCLYATFTGAIFTLIASLLINNITPLTPYINMPRPWNILNIFFFVTIFLWFERIAVKSSYDITRKDNNIPRVVIYGIQEGGVAMAKAIQNAPERKFNLVAFICPEGQKNPGYLMDLKVYLESQDLIKDLQEHDIKGIIISPLQMTAFRNKEDVINQLIDANIHIYIIPQVEEWDGKKDLYQSNIREVEIEDLLPREKIEVDMDSIGKMLYNKSILITGAAGSIGSEIVRQVATFRPKDMVLIDQAETPMHDLRLWMQREHPVVKVKTIVATITDSDYMDYIFSHHRPDYVFHAAAYKHVPMMENNPIEAVRNNIQGTHIIADLAVKYGTKKFVMISTDKAVNPTNVMGCSKRICEIYCQSLNAYINNVNVNDNNNSINHKPLTINQKPLFDDTLQSMPYPRTQFVTTRFGNVLGSNGSVIPLFREQIRNGGPLTVTHPDIIRYFMLIPEACKLVLEAGTMGEGGEIFVFDMGKPVKIIDLAKRMISLSGIPNIQIKFTGLRDGEKLYEELLSDKENTIPTPHPKIKVAKVQEYDYPTVLANEQRLLEATNLHDNLTIVKIMREIVPEYHPENDAYK